MQYCNTCNSCAGFIDKSDRRKFLIVFTHSIFDNESKRRDEDNVYFQDTLLSTVFHHVKELYEEFWHSFMRV